MARKLCYACQPWGVPGPQTARGTRREKLGDPKRLTVRSIGLSIARRLAAVRGWFPELYCRIQ